MITSLSGGVEGNLAVVNADGKLETHVTDTVTTQQAAYTVHRTSATVTTSSGALVGARPGRRSLWIQNQGANPVYLRFGAAAATTSDWLVPPLGEFRAEEFPFESEIRAISTTDSSTVLVLEMA